MAFSKCKAENDIVRAQFLLAAIEGFVDTSFFKHAFDSAKEEIHELFTKAETLQHHNIKLFEEIKELQEKYHASVEAYNRLNDARPLSSLIEPNVAAMSMETIDGPMFLQGMKISGIPKTDINQICQHYGCSLPTYVLNQLQQTPPKWSAVIIVGKTVRYGEGSSKVSAETMAATKILQIMKRHTFEQVMEGDVPEAQSSYERRQTKRTQERNEFAKYQDILNDSFYDDNRTKQSYVKGDRFVLDHSRQKKRMNKKFKSLNEDTGRNIDLESMVQRLSHNLVAKGYDVDFSKDNAAITQYALKHYHHTGVLPNYFKLKRFYAITANFPQVQKCGAHRYRKLVVDNYYLIDMPQNIKDNLNQMFGEGLIDDYVKSIIKSSIKETVTEMASDGINALKSTASSISLFIRGLFDKVMTWWNNLGIPLKIGIVLTASFIILTLLTSALWTWVRPVFNFFFGKELQNTADTQEKMKAEGGEIIKETVVASLKEYVGEFNAVSAQTDKCARFLINMRTLKDFFISVGSFARDCMDDFHKFIYGKSFTIRAQNIDEMKKAHEAMVDLVSNNHTSTIYKSAELMRKLVVCYQVLVRRFSTYTPAGTQAMTFHQSISRQMNTWKPIFDQCVYNLALIDKNQIRVEPLCIMLHGKAGGGKTYLVPVLQEVLKRVMTEVDFNPTDTWSRNPNEEYYSGYHGQWCCVYEEAFQVTDPAERAYQANDIIAMIGTQPLSLPMADLGSKGVTFFESDLVLITTNEISKPLVSITEPHALYRRYFAVEILENKKNLPKEFEWTELDRCYKFVVKFYDWENPDSYQARECNFSEMIKLFMQKVEYNRSREPIGNRFGGTQDIDAVTESCGKAKNPEDYKEKRKINLPQTTWKMKPKSTKSQDPLRPVYVSMPVSDGAEEEGKMTAQADRSRSRNIVEEGISHYKVSVTTRVKAIWDNAMNVLISFIKTHYNLDPRFIEDKAFLKYTRGWSAYERAMLDLLREGNSLDSIYYAVACYSRGLPVNGPNLYVGLPHSIKLLFSNYMHQKTMSLYPCSTDLPPNAYTLPLRRNLVNGVITFDVVISSYEQKKYITLPVSLHQYIQKDGKEFKLPICQKKDFTDDPEVVEILTTLTIASLTEEEEADYMTRINSLSAWHDPITTFFKNPLYTSMLLVGVSFVAAIAIGFLSGMGHEAPEIFVANSSHPQLKRFEKIWAKKKLPNTTSGVQAQSVDETFTQLARKCIRNTRLIRVHFAGNIMHSFVTFMEGTIGFTPNHSIPPNFDRIEMHISTSMAVMETITFQRSELKVKRWPMNDKCKLLFPPKRIPAFSSLRSHLPEKPLDDYTGMTRITYSDDGEALLYMPSTSAKLISDVDYDFDGVDIDNICVVECMGCAGIQGDCGTVYLLKQSASPKKIGGIHGAGSSKRSYAIPIFLSDLDEPFDDEPPVETMIIAQSEFVPAKSRKIIEGDLSHHGIHLPVICNLDKPHYQPTVTALAPSIIQEGVQIQRGNVTEIHKCPWEVKMAPAVLKGGPELSEISLRNLKGRERHALPPEVFDDECWVDLFPPAQARKWTIEEAINGVPGQLCSIDVHKCCGYPECDEGIKREDVVRLNTDPRGGYLAPFMRERIEEFEKKAMEGIATMQTFVECKKDELRTKVKVAEKKTRSFFMGTLTLLLLFRMYFGFWLSAISTAELSPIAIGINPYSTQWWQYYWKFKSYSGGRHIDSKDFQGWDLRFIAEFCHELTKRFLKAYGFDKLPLGIRRIYYCILYVHFYTHLLVAATVYLADIMVSGGPGTALINSAYNVVINRAATLRIMKQTLQVRIPMNYLMFLTVLGDDNYKAIRDFMIGLVRSIDVFTPKRYAEVIYEMFGLVSTTATKGEVGDFQTMETGDLLKRRFIRDSETGTIMCPMTLDDIQQHLLWINTASELPMKKQITENIHSALKEIFFHGRKVFDEQKAILNPFLESISEANKFNATWDDIYATYIKNIQKC